MRALILAPILMISALVAACDDKSNPAGPTGRVASLAINGVDYALTGSTTAYTATVTLSDGSTRTVTASWSSSAADVATVDITGRLEGRTHGSTTLTAAFDGRSASKTVRVVNNYAGSWSGQYIITACNDSGIFTDGIYGGKYIDVSWCQALNRVGSVHSFASTFSQTGTNYSEIRATFGSDTGPITGIVTADGRLKLEGTSSVLDWYGDPWGDWQLSGWDTNVDRSGGMTGRWAENLTMLGRSGHAYQEVEIVTMSRNATSAPSASPSR
jgi:hypothetical protein